MTLQGFYEPPAELDISARLRLSTAADEAVDPVTYEVLRHNLWHVNEEHGLTIANVSGSPVAVYAHDFNPCLLTETGEFVYFGPYVQFFAGMTDLMVKWVLEHRSDEPGIEEGDMFLSNDPFIGTHHQSDVFVLAPVFWDGELFCWTANALHQYDIGGSTPGSFCIDAEDVFDEPVPIPPVKVVERGRLRRDIAEMYLRHSRLPDIVGLDLRAQIAGNNVARDRILKLIERYGAATVKGVMRQILDKGARAFAEKLAGIPDGEWQARGFLEAARPGDRTLHRACMRLRKEGGVLTFDNEGTDPQTGSINTTYAGWRGAIMSVLNPFLSYDMLYAIGGALRHLRFDPTPGTILSAVHPASVSCAAAFGTQMAIDLAHECTVRMLGSAPDLRRVIAAPGGHSQTALTTLHGTDQRGRPYGTILTDHMLGSIGAFPWRDGVSTGGLYWDSQATAPNVEFNEQHYPVLYLYRREAAGSGGAGRFRGGNAAEMAIVPHRTERVGQVLIGGGVAVPSAAGLAGGAPGDAASYRVRVATDIRTVMAGGCLPRSLDELAGHDRPAPPKSAGVLGPDDVFEMGWTAAAGYGDPLDRDPGRVSADIADGAVPASAARDVYCVALAADGSVDTGATEALRRAERDRRASLAPDAQVARVQGDTLAELSEDVLVAAGPRGPRLACARCRADLGSAESSYRDGCVREALPLAAAGDRVHDPARYVDAEVEFRCFYCPGCFVRLATEVGVAGEPSLPEITLRIRSEVAR